MRRGLGRVESAEYDEALADLEEAERIAEEAGDKGLVAAARINQGYVFSERGDAETALRLYAEATDIASAAQDPRRLRAALSNVCVALRQTGRYELTIEAITDYLELVGDDEVARASALLDRGLCLIETSEFSRAMEDLEEAGRLARHAGSTDVVTAAYLNLGLAREEYGDISSAMRAYRALTDVAIEAGADPVHRQALLRLARCYRTLGRPSDAIGALAEAEEIDRRLDDATGAAETLGLHGWALRECDRTDEALEKWRAEEIIRRELQQGPELGDCLLAQAQLLQSAGDHAEALALYEDAERAYRPHGVAQGLADALYGQGMLLRRSGDLVGALARADEALQVMTEVRSPALEAKTRGLRIMLLAEMGDTEAATEELDRAEETCADLGLVAPLVWMLARRGYVHACAGGSPEEVAALLETAYEHGASREVARAGGRAVRKMTVEIVKRRGDEYGEALMPLVRKIAADSGDADRLGTA